MYITNKKYGKHGIKKSQKISTHLKQKPQHKVTELKKEF